MVAGVEG
jgi:hypothetical protein